jgi:hypothetical protein
VGLLTTCQNCNLKKQVVQPQFLFAVISLETILRHLFLMKEGREAVRFDCGQRADYLSVVEVWSDVSGEC